MAEKTKMTARKTQGWARMAGFSLAMGVCLTLVSGCAGTRYSGLVSWKEYNRHPRENPYILELESPSGSLIYFGVFHSTDKVHNQFRIIEDKWRQFRPEVAFSEGGIWPLERSKDLSISRHGEQGLLRYLSERDGVKLKSIEPRRIQEAIHLSRYFCIQKIKVFYILRQAVIQRMLNKPMDDSHVTHILADFDKPPFCNVCPTSAANFRNHVAKLFPELGDWRDIPEHWFYSLPAHPWLPRMFRMVNEFRNQFMIRKVLKQVKKGKRVFALVGRSHVVMQEPVLRDKIKGF